MSEKRQREHQVGVRLTHEEWKQLSRDSTATGLSFGALLRQSYFRQAFRDLLPDVGSEWVWEPLKSNARCEVRVTEVRWVDPDWMVESELLDGGERYWNDLSRWVEATVFPGLTPDRE